MTDPSALTFEQLLDALEELTTRMARGDIGIEEATELYEQAGKLHGLAADRLDAVRARIAALTETPADDT